MGRRGIIWKKKHIDKINFDKQCWLSFWLLHIWHWPRTISRFFLSMDKKVNIFFYLLQLLPCIDESKILHCIIIIVVCCWRSIKSGGRRGGGSYYSCGDSKWMVGSFNCECNEPTKKVNRFLPLNCLNDMIPDPIQLIPKLFLRFFADQSFRQWHVRRVVDSYLVIF